jgi:hypothetical protein
MDIQDKKHRIPKTMRSLGIFHDHVPMDIPGKNYRIPETMRSFITMFPWTFKIKSTEFPKP